MADGENLADFHPTIAAAERVIEGGGLLSGDEAEVTTVAAEALAVSPDTVQPEGRRQ
jgi:hypothetical protein